MRLTSVVRPFIRFSRAACTKASDSASSAVVCGVGPELSARRGFNRAHASYQSICTVKSRARLLSIHVHNKRTPPINPYVLEYDERTRGGLVEDEHLGALEDGPCDGQPLPAEAWYVRTQRERDERRNEAPSQLLPYPTVHASISAVSPLPAAQSHAPFANQRVEAVGEALDELQSVGLPRRLAHCRLSCHL